LERVDRTALVGTKPGVHADNFDFLSELSRFIEESEKEIEQAGVS
jgi:hypothetical protein